MARMTLRPPVPLGQGFGLLWATPVRVDDPGLEAIVTLDLAVEGDHLVVTKFTADQREGGPPITIDFLKSMPLVGLTQRAVEGGLLNGLVRTRTKGHLAPATAEDLASLSEVERAAVVYRAAIFIGFPPTLAVADACGWSHDVAAKRVQAARKAELLEPTTKGRKGA